jgi:hypothetical protein
MKFEIFGNSHAALLTGAPPCGKKVSKQKEKPFGRAFTNVRGFTDVHPLYPFRTWFLGPVLAYNFYEHHLFKIYEYINTNLNLFNQETMLLLQVGEIDCRVHLPKYVTGNRSTSNVVEECVTRYHRSILDLKNNGYKIGVMGMQPSMCDESIKNKMPIKEQSYNISGNTKLRNDISKKWDEFHNSLCNESDIPYISIYDDLVDKDGLAKEEYFIDFIHLSHDKTIEFWIKKLKDLKLL